MSNNIISNNSNSNSNSNRQHGVKQVTLKCTILLGHIPPCQNKISILDSPPWNLRNNTWLPWLHTNHMDVSLQV